MWLIVCPGVSSASSSSAFAHLDHVTGRKPSVDAVDARPGVLVREQLGTGRRDHRAVAAGVIAVFVRVEDLRDLPALRLRARETLLVIERIHRQRFAAVGADDQIVEVAVRIAGPDLLDDHDGSSFDISFQNVATIPWRSMDAFDDPLLLRVCIRRDPDRRAARTRQPRAHRHRDRQRHRTRRRRMVSLGSERARAARDRRTRKVLARESTALRAAAARDHDRQRLDSASSVFCWSSGCCRRSKRLRRSAGTGAASARWTRVSSRRANGGARSPR